LIEVATMTLSKPKSPARIEVWRHEVSASTAPFTPSESAYLAPPIRQPSFWKKILRRDSKSSGSGSASKSRNQDYGKDSVKTEMYEPGEKEADDRLRVPEQEVELGRDSSMEIGSGESELGGLRERRERLERAAKLLNWGGKGKEDKGRKEAGG
jgi:hypothetical protein